MNSLNKINSDHLRKVVARLPFYNQSRWRDRASDLLRERGMPPNFRDLTEFLQRRAESENNARFGNLKDPDKEISNLSKRELQRKMREESISSFATQYTSGRLGHVGRAVCPVCQVDHNLPVCQKFLQMTVVERRKAVLKLKLCFQFLFPGHYKRFCKKSKRKVESCERRHHKLLHLPKQKDQETNTSQEEFNIRETTKRDANVQTNAANVLPQVKRGATALPVVAVKVHGADGLEATTYALLDQASEASFIHTNLAKELHLEGPKGILSIKSLTGTTSIEG